MNGSCNKNVIVVLLSFLIAGCVDLPISGPYDQLSGSLQLHSQATIRTVDVTCVDRDKNTDACLQIMPPLKEHLISMGYAVDSPANPDLSLRLSMRYECEPTEYAPFFLGIISMYGIGYTPSVCGFKMRALYKLGKRQAKKTYSIYSAQAGKDQFLLEQLITAIREDIDWIGSTLP